MHDIPHLLLHFVLVFVGRHWLVAFVNAGLTALLGGSLLRLSRLGRIFSATQLLGLSRLVLLAALLKGSFYLVQGDSMRPPAGSSLVLALQFPDPIESLAFTPQSHLSIWQPTAATEWVSVLLIGWAFLSLIRRAWEMRRSQRALLALVRLGSDSPFSVSEALRRASVAMGLPVHTLPPVVLADVDYPTPLLLGVTQPCLLLSPSMVAILTEEEMEMAFRHELAHLRRRDHWGRWVQIWVQDVGQLNFLSSWLGALAIDAEETLCDRMAVRSARDATALGGAIAKATSFGTSRGIRTHSRSPGNSRRVPPDEVVPALQGRYLRRQRPTALHQRLKGLASHAQEFADVEYPCFHGLLQSRIWLLLLCVARVGFALVLFLILYVKIHLTLSLS